MPEILIILLAVADSPNAAEIVTLGAIIDADAVSVNDILSAGRI